MLLVFLVLGGFFLLWYLLGNEYMRRRARTLALWCKRALDPIGGTQTVRWLTTQSFRLDISQPRSPFKHATITGLVESWDVPVIWLWNRLRGRRDMVLLQLELREQPLWGFELFRAGSILADDARHVARQEGWTEAQLDELRLASPGPPATELAGALLRELSEQRADLIRLAVRRRDTHLSLALNMPDPVTFEPARLSRVAERLAQVATRQGSDALATSLGQGAEG